MDDEANQHIVLKERKELGKPHISKKMRALLKSSGKQVCIKELTKNTESVAEPEVSVTWWRDGQKTYRDEQYYINPEMPMTRDNEDFLNVQQDDVSRMAASVNNALFELVPDEAQSITNKQRITRWDNKRKRYVTGTVGELKDNVHIRNESGQLVKSHSKVKRGELYNQWKKSHKVSEQSIGGEDVKVDYRGGRRG